MKTLLLLFLLTIQSLEALISITPIEIGEKPNLQGKVYTSLQTKRGNTDKDNYKAGLNLTYDSNSSYVTWAEISGEYGESTGQEDTNKAYFHLRHIHAITKNRLRAEIFTQVQKDKFRLIKKRFLVGAGIRTRIFETTNNGVGYIGLGGMYETLKYTSGNDPKEYNARFNTYLTYSLDLSEKSKLSYSFYFQPKTKQLNDYTQSHKLDLKLKIYKTLFLQLRVAYDLDSLPAIGVNKYDFYQETAFVLNF